MILNIAQALDILSAADRGTWTAPDGAPQDALTSAFVVRALSVAHPDRAWAELESLLAAQWPDGMVPHLVYHQPTEAFPASGLWVTGRPVTTSGLTALPIWGSVLRRLHERAPDAARARAALTVIDRWHGWFGTHRDPQGTGLFAILHPWESGRPDAPEWQVPFSRVPTEGVASYLPAAAPAAQARSVWLIERFRSLGWETPELHDTSPFRVVDPGANAVLIRSCEDLAALADALEEPEMAEGNRLIAQRARVAMDRLMQDGRYLPLDRITGHRIQTASVGTVLPAWAGLPVEAQVEGVVEPWAAALVADAPAVRMEAPVPADDVLAAALFIENATAASAR
ncbi:MGH1-like glycoside hydrolase domain-containing protein [Falsirhodobacter sp. 1013]|uniref:MGH1-like glycoside hydrolase domain-containing protein n=1 Tax=Falsirhodobacter sp. 1013 TaxID=3417566 RepID=UPI003EB8529E